MELRLGRRGMRCQQSWNRASIGCVMLGMGRCLAFVITAAIAVGAAARAQTPAVSAPVAPATQTASHYEYAVATIKPDESGRGNWRNAADGFTAVTPAFELIMSAYSLHMPDQISGLPGWASSEMFAIVARMDPDTAEAMTKLPPMEQVQQRQQMLQKLLADRFALKVHRTTKQLPIYMLTVADSGKLKKSESDTGGNARYSDAKIEAHGVSIESLAFNLSNRVGRIIVNQTGLAGTYDFTLEWAPDGADASDPRPSIFTALEEQIGLKLKPAQGPVDAIVVDSIAQPSAN